MGENRTVASTVACAGACTAGTVVGELLLVCRAFLTESSLHPSVNAKKGTEGFKPSMQVLGWLMCSLFGTPPESYLLCRGTLAKASLLLRDPRC